MSTLQQHDRSRVNTLWVSQADIARRAAEQFAEVRRVDSPEDLLSARAVNLIHLLSPTTGSP